MTREEFEYHVPSAVMPDDTLFERIAAHLADGEASVQSLLGRGLYDQRSQDLTLLNLCNRVVCLEAYNNAIPHLDLVLTENGFGVVSNQNVAPASSERVNRLREQVKQSLDDAIDDLLDYLRGNPLWVSTDTATAVFRSLVWNGRQQLVYFAVLNGHRSTLDELRPKIAAAEERIKHCISHEFFNELCDALRLRTATTEQNTAIHKILMTIGADVTEDKAMAHFHVKKLVEWLDGNIRTFPTYANSTAYAANTFEPYKNEKDDPCFFFG
ncbi:MAG: hypothetical protein IJT30_08690 [Muribaculaceae bacterium]|nr:hypothetical protein [Muribaculaceae bacterium]